MKNVAGMSYFSSASITAGVVSGFGPSSNVNATTPLGSSPSMRSALPNTGSSVSESSPSFLVSSAIARAS